MGGAAVTEEIVPGSWIRLIYVDKVFLMSIFTSGYKFSRASYVLSLLRPQIVRDLELKRHGLKVYLRDPGSYTPLRKEAWRPQADGGIAKSLILGRDHEANVKQISQFSAKDAANLGPFEAQLERYAAAIEGLLDTAPPDLSKSYLSKEFYGPAKAVVQAGLSLGTKDLAQFYELMTAPITKILGHWFESEPLTASLATDALIGTMVIKGWSFCTLLNFGTSISSMETLLPGVPNKHDDHGRSLIF